MPTRPALSHDRTGVGPLLVLVHGFTQTRHCWSPFDVLIGRGRELLRADAPGHGGSGDLDLDLWAGADALAATIDRPADLLGYSMGGRLALHTALAHPPRVRRLVLIGATAGIADEAERGRRRAADDALADHLEAVGVDAFLDEWLARPLFAGLDATTAHRSRRLANTAAGLATSLRLAGTGAMEPLWVRLTELAMPVLLVAGADDTRFASIAAEMAEAIGANAEVAVIGGAGHTAHLERPEATATTVRSWLGSTDAADR